jgi:hypothetical protein
MNNIHSHVRNRIHGGLLNHSRNVEKQLNERDDLQAVEEWEKIDEKLYYNLQLRNKDIDRNNNIYFIPPKDLIFNINRVDSIISNNLEQYEVAVEYFSIDTSFIPIFYVEENDLYTYQIEIEEQANPINSDELFVNFYQFSENGRVFNYTEMIDAVNITLQNLCNTLGIPNSPFLKINSNNKYEFWCDNNFYDDLTDPLNPILATYRINFSKLLGNLFSCFTYADNTFPGQAALFSRLKLLLDYKQGDTLVNYGGVNYLVTTQQFDPRPAMLDANRLIFLTDMTVKDELLGEKDDNQQRQLLDYIINDRILDKTKINFYPQIRRWINLTNSSELRRMTVRVLLEANNGQLYQYKLAQNENFFMKLIFRRKQK